MPARSPRVTNLVAILRLASSIISSPNITAPLRSPSVVAFSYASRMSKARSNCSCVGVNTSLMTDDLVRVQRPLAVVAEDAGAHRVVAQRVELADLEERPVDHLEAVRPAGHEDLGEHVVEVVARVLGDLHPTGEHRHLGRGREVGRAEDDRLDPRRRRADLLDVDEAARGLDLRLDADAAARARSTFSIWVSSMSSAMHVGRATAPSAA